MRLNVAIRIVLAVVFAAGMWGWVECVLVPYQRAEAVEKQIPRGNLSDLYPRWLGTREYLRHGRDPYGAEVTRDIQTGYWGRPLDPNKPNDPRDEARFAYPVYVMFLLAPTIGWPFVVVQWTFALLLGMMALASVPLWLRVIGFRVSRSTLAIIIVLTAGSFPLVQGCLMQQLTLLVLVLLAASAASVVRGNLVLGGVLLACATIKPQLAAPIVAWYFVWTMGDVRRRYRLMISFAGVMILLLAASELLMPGWIWRFYDALHSYLQYNDAMDMLQSIFGYTIGRVLQIGLFIAVAAACWLRRREPAGSPVFGWIVALVLTANLLLMPKWASYDQVLLLPAVLWIGSQWSQSASRRVTIRYTVFSLPLVWQWLSTLALSLIAIASSALAQRFYIAPLVTVLAVPVAVLAALLPPPHKVPGQHELTAAQVQAGA